MRTPCTGSSGHLDTIAIVAEEGRTQTEVRDAVRAALDGGGGSDGGAGGVEVITGDTLVAESQETAQATFTGIRTFLLAFALISVLVGTFVIYTSFSFIVAQRQRQVALLRALGAGRGQVLISVVVESLLVGVLASVVGYGVGVVLATALTGAFVPGTAPVILPQSAALALGVGTLVTMASVVGTSVVGAAVVVALFALITFRADGRRRRSGLAAPPALYSWLR